MKVTEKQGKSRENTMVLRFWFLTTFISREKQQSKKIHENAMVLPVGMLKVIHSIFSFGSKSQDYSVWFHGSQP